MNEDQIKYVPNKFESYTATRNFGLGTTGMSITGGAEVQFDGTTIIFNESKYVLPGLRGAIKLGWLVPSSTYDPEALLMGPVSANIGLRPAVTNSQSLTQQPTRTAAVTVQSDERVVMTRDAATPQNTGVTRQVASKQQRPWSRSSGYDVEPQDARPVARTFKTAAKTSTDMAYAGAAISQAEAVKINPGQGLSEAEYMARLNPDELAKYLSDKEAKKAVYTAELLSKGHSITPPVVAQVPKVSSSSTSQGIRSTVTVGGGIETYDASTGDAKPAMSTVSSEGITFSNTNGPKRAFQNVTPAPAGNGDFRMTVAKSICPDFPDNYSFDDPPKRRLARIQLDYSDRPDIIRAIFAVETDDFKLLILGEFPEAFRS